MKMNKEWLKIYESKARDKKNPDYVASCWSKEGFDELLEVTKNIFKKKERNQTILDVGCGPGNYCKLLSDMNFDIIGMDYSEEMIKRAKKNYPKLKFLIGNGYNIPFNDNSFDIVLSIGVITCLSDYEKFIKELKRVSKKTIILSTLLRIRKVDDVKEYLKRKLITDSWPTMTYHPSELIELFEKEKYSIEIITHHKNDILSDGFFLIARKK